MSFTTPSVLVMPDLFVDRLVKITKPLNEFVSDVENCFQRGGGNLFGNEQEIVLGGNAANLARALGVLGVHVTLTVVTDALGASIAQFFLTSLPVDIIVHHVRNSSKTVALEFIDQAQNISRNVMISDPGDLRHVHPKEFLDTIGQGIKQHDVVAIVNQANNDNYAELVRMVHDRTSSQCRLFLDFADLSSRTREFVQHLSTTFDLPKVEWIGMNDNECRSLSKFLLSKRIASNDEDALVATSKQLSVEHGRTTWLLHTPTVAMAFKDGDLIGKAKAFKLKKVTRATGAGDTWNAGFLASIITSECSIEEALKHANALAGFFIQEGDLPNAWDDVWRVFAQE